MLYFFPLEDFLPDLEILKPPEEPGLAAGLIFICRPASVVLLDSPPSQSGCCL
jgi:hypothetical protein